MRQAVGLQTFPPSPLNFLRHVLTVFMSNRRAIGLVSIQHQGALMENSTQEQVVRSANAFALLDVDEAGFMRDPDHWNTSAARMLADIYEVGPLGRDHWAIIYYLREHRLTYGSLPPMSQVCRTHGMQRGAVQRLFGGCLQAWRISGLPDPGEEAKTYMT
jgi:sulfur relay (sulfurtransferase) DsrC/TusE family protein